MESIRIASAILTIAAAASLTASAAVIDGSYTVVTPDRDDTGVTRALDELAGNVRDVFEEAGGFRLKRATYSTFKGGRAIWIGAAPAAKAGLLPADLKGFSNCYAEKGGDLYFFGNDRPGKRNVKRLHWRKCILPSVAAAARFMERELGVAFLAPGKTGCDVPKRARIEVKDGLFSREDPFIRYAPARLDTMLYSYATWQFGDGEFHTYGGHTYPAACPVEKYFATHPEYFGLVGGKRVGEKGNPTLCISNPEVKKLIVAELLKRYDEGSEVCQLGQQDGGQFCECEKCRNYGGVKEIGEQLWIFHCEIAREIERLRPGKIVHIMCYGPTFTLPKSFREFPSNVMIEHCNPSSDGFRKWDGYTVPHGFTTYNYLWGNYPFLGLMARHSYAFLSDNARLQIRNRVFGVYRCGYGEFYGTEGPGYYVFNKTLMDPSLDPQQLADEYCTRAYGPAVNWMKTFHDTLDRRLRMTDLISAPHCEKGTPENRALWACCPKSALDLHALIYTADTVRTLDDALANAERTAGLTEKQTKRIRLVRLEYDYARTMGRIATFWSAYQAKPCAATFEPLGDEVEKRKALVAKILNGQKRAARLPWWPEIRFFGEFEAQELMTNGRLSATLGAPLGWDIPLLRAKGVCPGEKLARATVRLADGEDWSKAPWQELGGCQLQEVPRKARFKIVAGETALKIRIESDLDDALQVKGYEHDGPCWRRESAELLIDPTGTRSRTYHLIVNPVEGSSYDEVRGLITDILDPYYNRFDGRWNGDWSFTTARKDNVWTTVLTLPYATLGTARPKPGDRWNLNIGRAARMETGRSADQILMLWNPNLAKARCLPDPDAMGELVFE